MKLYIKYMVSMRCKKVVKDELQNLGLKAEHIFVDLGEVEILSEITPKQRILLKEKLLLTGLEVLDDNRSILIEKIINVVMEMVLFSEDLPKKNYSDYISDKLEHNYTYLATMFSEVKGITLQQFIIIQKIERVKEFLIYNELNLTEISYKLQYSSVAHLSGQFKKITGLSPTFFKQLRQKRSELLEKI